MPTPPTDSFDMSTATPVAAGSLVSADRIGIVDMSGPTPVVATLGEFIKFYISPVSGIVKSNGSTLSAAVAGTDYLAPTGSGAGLTGITVSQVSGALAAANNLSDVADGPVAAANLGLGTGDDVTFQSVSSTFSGDGSGLTGLNPGSLSGPVGVGFGGLGASNAASTGVPLFTAGVVTIVATSGTGDFIRAGSPTFSGTVTVPVLTVVNGGGYGFSIQPGNATSYWYVTNTGAGGTLAWATSAKGTLQVRSSNFGSSPQATCEWEVVGTAEDGFRLNAPASYSGYGYSQYENGVLKFGVAGGGVVTAASFNGVTVANGGSGALTVTGTASVSGSNTGDQFTSVTASRLLGRGSAGGAGAAQEITLGAGFTMTGTTISVSAGGGNVSTSGSPVTGDYARWASASTIESRTASQVRGDIGLGSGDDVTFQSVTAAGYNGDGSALTDLNASQLTSGSVAYARGGFGGDISLSVGVPVFNAGSVAFVGTDGTGSFARVSSPTFTTPNIGAATATSVNGVTVTNGGTGKLTVTGTTSVSGSNTGDQTSVTGNAGTATALQTARNINGVSFNGTADITVTAAAGTLTGTTMAANVVTSSLTTVGTIGAGVWQGTAVGVAYGGSGATTAVGARAAFGFVALTTTATSGTVTIDCSAADITYVLSLTNNVTLALSNEADGRRFTLWVRGQASGYTITWFSGIKWVGGAAPTIPTVSGRVMAISFIRLGSGEWVGIPAAEAY